MKTKHRRWQLTVFSILMVLCVLLAAQEASKSVSMTRGGSDTTSQTLTLNRGWNWVGFNVLPTSRTVGDVLGTTGFTVNDIIQTNGVSARFTGTSWTPENFTIEYGRLYQIYVTNTVTVSVNGVAGSPSSLPLLAGWNWIANSTLENAALSQLTHSNGWGENDRIQTAGGNGAAYILGKWTPSVFNLESGKGYQIFTANAGSLSFPATVDDDALYVVVDLSGGPDATSYPVRYTNTAPDLDDDTCRTTELWLRKIPAGTFIMGSPVDEVGRDGNDMTQHEVTITQDYYIGVFECTQKQWELVMGINPSTYKGDCRPVEYVSFDTIRGTGAQAGAGWPTYGHTVDASSFMGKLQAKTGLVFDLPTEAQWEYACRAGTTTALNSGMNLTNIASKDVNMDKVGRYDCNQSDDEWDYSQHTKVGSYLPNAWGLYDMHGNVWEWTLDWYGASTTSMAAEMDPVGPSIGTRRVFRGGSWEYRAQDCRSASRCNPDGYPTSRWDDDGFRVFCLPRQDLYAVVDLSAGPEATNYPVRYTDIAPNLDDDTCRTTELWLRKIPAGTFIMGSPEDEVGRRSDDMALHQVTITDMFYIGVFECTQKQWELVMGSNPSNKKGDCRPVEQVSYNMIRGSGEKAGAGWPTYGHTVDGSSFMGKLQEKTGLVFDLPTEAQRQYACRAGTTTTLYSGKNLTNSINDPATSELGRYRYNQSDGKGGYTSGHTKVGSYLPNAWGLYDMYGNVDEWCLDWWGTSTTSTAAKTDPVGPSMGSSRVVCCGGWDGYSYDCRSASRGNYSPWDYNIYFGFRIACHPQQDLYVVVDLSEGPDATNYPVRYTNTAPNLDDDTCRTTELWLKKIPAGTFLMGSPEDEVGHYNGYDETQHQVTLTQDYYMGVFECTQRQWELVMGTKPSYFNNVDYYATRPVERVSYEMIRGTSASAGAGWPMYGHAVDATSFMGKLQAKTGLMFDLPTEAQWEYACRAGTTTALNSGKDLTSEDQDANMAEVGRYWYNGGSGDSQSCTPDNGTAKVGSYLQNAWRLYDMHGNVGEWCLDGYGGYGTDSVEDPQGMDVSDRVIRGGGWSSYANSCRSATRVSGYRSVNYYSVGFRVLYLPRQDLYAVVDLSGGPNATNYPVRYTNTAPNLDDDTCRTTELWLRKIPSGTFIMGSSEDEVGRNDRDMALHNVTITNDYYIGVFECTQRQWELVMGTKPSYFNNENYYATRPVEQVSYGMIRGTSATAGAGWPTYGHAVDSTSFMGKLKAKTGLVFDLPTEAQWEYACRAGTTTALNSGKNLTSTEQDTTMNEVGRYYYNSGSVFSQNCAPTCGTMKVGSYFPNAWGLYDMHGNVKEWCLDLWGASTTSTVAETDPVGYNSGSTRVLRGGYWSSDAQDCRSADRGYNHSLNVASGNGFRIVFLP